MDIAAEESAKSESRNSSKNSNITGTPKSGSSVKFSNTKELVIVRKDSPPKLPSATTKADHGVLEKGGSFPERTRPKSAVIDGTTRSSVVGQREISRKMVAASGRKNDVEDDDDDINIEMKPATSRPSDVLWSTSVREFLETQKTPSEELAAKPIPVEKVGSKQSRKSIGERGEGIRLRSDSKEVKKKQAEEAGGKHAKERQPKKDHRKKRDSRSAEALKKGTQRRSEDKVRERLVESLKYASSGATVHRKAKIKEPSTSGAAMSLEGTSDMTMSPTSALSGFSSLGFSFSEISSKTEMIEEEIEFTAAQGYDDNIQFEKSSTDSDLSCIDSEETEEPTDSSFSGLDTTVTPFVREQEARHI